MESTSPDQPNMEDRDISTSATTNTISKINTNQNQLDTSTVEISKALSPNIKSMSSDKTNTQNRLEPMSSTTNTTSEVTLDEGNPNDSTIRSSGALHDIIELNPEKNKNADNIKSAIPNTTLEEDPAFICDQLALQSALKAQETLCTLDSSVFQTEDTRSVPFQDSSSQTANLAVTNVRSARLEEKNQPVIDGSTQQVLQPAPEFASDNSLISPTSASTDSLSYTSAMISISQACTSD
ncbi:uncharacterized protein MELLADRAFT_88989 [Melampsora larici-populina 98AG31]|uniref:Uncharacterized protein n=1 Tax=Melampsora larici-populina (strain 98AG31 / pathotype 3-4-7) TaxID=747676 RepID=F4R6J1_MELLP|nr:uncharacterized protein MELLADRAFT_88989 [Melampsora larici-populina 98AG31]EGG11890.1 hypothetical protein MELLADRAFT_88989 [Melampsora larici-populina 98AG31]